MKTTNYDALSVEEVARRIEGLPTEQLRKVREFEKKNKDRETLVAQIDRKIRDELLTLTFWNETPRAGTNLPALFLRHVATRFCPYRRTLKN